MGEHAFEDARKQNPEHPFNSPAYQGASVLVVGQNFGCGSSREHAPQALMRWGIRAIVGGSFGEIFFGNCVILGIPCLVATQADLEWLQKAVERAPQAPVQVDVEKQEVRFGDRVDQGDHARRPAQPARGGNVGFDGGAAGGGRVDRGDGEQAAVRPGVLNAPRPARRSPSIVESPRWRRYD